MGEKAGTPAPKTVFVRMTATEKKDYEHLAKEQETTISNLFKKAITFYEGYLEGKSDKH